MYVIGPMIIYLCERLVRFIRYMQRVQYRKVRWIHEPSAACGCYVVNLTVSVSVLRL